MKLSKKLYNIIFESKNINFGNINIKNLNDLENYLIKNKKGDENIFIDILFKEIINKFFGFPINKISSKNNTNNNIPDYQTINYINLFLFDAKSSNLKIDSFYGGTIFQQFEKYFTNFQNCRYLLAFNLNYFIVYERDNGIIIKVNLIKLFQKDKEEEIKLKKIFNIFEYNDYKIDNIYKEINKNTIILNDFLKIQVKKISSFFPDESNINLVNSIYYFIYNSFLLKKK